MSKRENDRNLQLVIDAFEEFETHGEVKTVKREACGTPLKITTLSETAWKLRCECGRYEDTLRGL